MECPREFTKSVHENSPILSMKIHQQKPATQKTHSAGGVRLLNEIFGNWCFMH